MPGRVVGRPVAAWHLRAHVGPRDKPHDLLWPPPHNAEPHICQSQQGPALGNATGWLGPLEARVVQACHIKSEAYGAMPPARGRSLNTLANGRSGGLMFPLFFAVRALRCASISVPGG